MASTLANGTRAEAARSDQFGRLITVNVRHGFYNPAGSEADGPCPDLVIEPTPHTVGRLARFGLLLRRRPDGIEILHSARHAAMLGSIAAAFPGGLSFETARRLFGPPLLFAIRLAIPQFLNITQMADGFGTGSRALLLSNNRTRLTREPAGPADGGGADIGIDWSHFVAPPAGATEGEAEPGDVRAGAEHARGRHEPNAAYFEDAAEREAIRSDSNGLPFATLEIHVIRPPGEDGRPAPGVFAVDPFRAPHAGGGTPDADGGWLRPVVYDLRFEARRTRWRYVIADRNGRLDGTSLSIVDPGPSAASFTAEPDAPTVPGALRSFAFLSEAALPLRQRPSTRFALTGAALGGRRGLRPLVDPLPAPDPGTLSRRTAAAGPGGAADLSEIHVFV